MTAEAIGTIIQGTRRPFQINLVGDGRLDLTTVTGVDLYVRRNAGVTETWTMTIVDGATAGALSATYAPTESGPGSVTVAKERIHCRPILHVPSGPDVEVSFFILFVEER
ncbi:MAG TPA: hypothetical protein VIU64_11825 [Polyangia bacterium]